MTRLAFLLVVFIGCTTTDPVSEPHLSGTSDETHSQPDDAGVANRSDHDAPATPEEFCEVLAKPRCAGQFKCCADVNFADMDSCRRYYASACLDLFENGHVSYSTSVAGQVLSSVEDAYATCGPATHTLGSFEPGSLAEGEECSRDGSEVGRCGDGLYCDRYDGHEARATGACRHERREGQSCGGSSDFDEYLECADGLYCDSYDGSEPNPNPVCRRRPILGEPCNPDDDWCWGGTCNESSRVCERSRCDEDDDCGDYACEDGYCTDVLSGRGYHCFRG